jgi:predicted TIM-barrel fold metal-dependent hydrolase
MNWDSHVHVFGPPARFPLASSRGYAPPLRSLGQLEEAAAAAGIVHLVLVQPSVYGTDNFCLLEALREGAGRHRGVVVVDSGVSTKALERMHEVGVRGVRFNLVSPDGNGLAGFERIARAIEPLGWHIQFLVPPEGLQQVLELRARCAAPFMLDHFGGIAADRGERSGHAAVLLKLLVRDDCWIKLSGFYRLSAKPGWSDMDSLLIQLATIAPDRVVWGSDWPHTWFFSGEHGPAPAYADTLAPLLRCLPPEIRSRALQDNPWRLYL